jgi:hypothetical protein
MRHFVVREVEPVEFTLKCGRQTAERGAVGHCQAPRDRELVLDFLELPHETENLQIVVHDFLSEDGRKRGQIVDSIVKLEHFPAAITLIVLQQLHIKSIKEFRCVELCIA